MTVSDFIKQDKQIQKEEDRLMKKLHELGDKRADLQIALDKESRSTLWKELEGKALKDSKGAMWEFKKLKKTCGEWYVTLAYSKPGEVSTNLDRNLANCLQWLSNYDMELVEVPVKCSVIENYIKGCEALRAQFIELAEKKDELADRSRELKTELYKGKKGELLRFLKAHKIVLDKGTYTFKSLRKERLSPKPLWVVTCMYECPGIKPYTFSVNLANYLDYCTLPGGRLESV